MAVNLPEFLYDSNNEFVTKTSNLIKNWSVGIACCKKETELVIYNMYAKLLSTDLSDYNITTDEILTILNSVINDFNLVTINITQGDTIIFVNNNIVTNNYITNVVYEAPTYNGVYDTAINGLTLTVVHGLNKRNPTVIVTDTSTGNRIRVEAGIVELSTNSIQISFSSASSGDYTIM